MDRNMMINSLSGLGEIMGAVSRMEGPSGDVHPLPDMTGDMASLVKKAEGANPWFIPRFTRYALGAWARALQADSLTKWMQSYPALASEGTVPARVGIVMAGNLPMVGLHDLVCVLASGNQALVKLSSQDEVIIPALVDQLIALEPAWEGRVSFIPDVLKNFDAVIATGSDNTSRYFEYYFNKYPHIIRRNRNGVAVITGDEPSEWYRALADDLFLYFGLGCRNVSKLYLPEGFIPGDLFDHFAGYRFLEDHHKYVNNYDYQKSIMMINGIEFLDNGFVLMRQEASLPAPVSVINFEYYSRPEWLQDRLREQIDQIQCVVAMKDIWKDSVPAGKSQLPELWDYADGIDTMEFLGNLKKN